MPNDRVEQRCAPPLREFPGLLAPRFVLRSTPPMPTRPTRATAAVGIGATLLVSALPAVAQPAAPPTDDSSPRGEEPEVVPPSRFRGSTFTWNHTVRTSQTSRRAADMTSPLYAWGLALVPTFQLLDAPRDRLAAFAELGVYLPIASPGPYLSVDLAEGDVVTLEDPFLGLEYAHTLWETGGPRPPLHATVGALSGRLVFPASDTSRRNDRYLATSIGPTLGQRIGLLGPAAAGLTHVELALDLRWAHVFAKYAVVDRAYLRRPFQTERWSIADVLAGDSDTQNQLVGALSARLPIYRGASVAGGAALVDLIQADSGADPCTTTALGTACAPHIGDARTHFPSTVLRASVGYDWSGVVQTSAGYATATSWIIDMPRGTYVQLYFDVIVQLDRLGQSAGGRTPQPARAVGAAEPAAERSPGAGSMAGRTGG